MRLRSSSLVCLHFTLIVLNPFVYERLSRGTFLVVHETTVVTLIAINLLFLMALSLMIFIMTTFMDRVTLRLDETRWRRSLVMLPTLIYFGAVSAKFVERGEWTLLFSSTAIVVVLLFLNRRPQGRIGALQFIVVTLVTSFGVMAVLASQVIPFATWKQTSNSSADAQGTVQPNVIWLILDELGRNQLFDQDSDINAALYPNFADLAKRSTFYSRTVASHSFTDRALPSMLTGRLDALAKNLPSRWYETTFNRFSQIGYSDIDLPVCSPGRCDSPRAQDPSRLSTLVSDAAILMAHKFLPSFITNHIPGIDSGWSNFGREIDRDARAIQWLDAVEVSLRGQRPTIAIAHSLITHHNWSHTGLGSTYFPTRYPFNDNHYITTSCDAGNLPEQMFCSDGVAELTRRTIGLNLKAADDLVGRLLRILDAVGKAESTMLIVTSDHGAAIAGGVNERLPAPDSPQFGDVALVPLFVKYPGQLSPERVDSPRSSTQIVGTILETLGFDVPSGIQPSLRNDPRTITLNGVEVSLPILQSGSSIGGLARVENPTYPLAIGRLAQFMGTRIESFGPLVRIVDVARPVLDLSHQSRSPHDRKFRVLFGGYIPRNACAEGNLALIDGGRLVGTLETYRSLRYAESDGVWGVAESDFPITSLTASCITTANQQ